LWRTIIKPVSFHPFKTPFAVLLFGSAISADFSILAAALEVVARFACFARRRSAAPVIQESSTP